jgi:nitrite reductase/ring-hydroxylating ferredoxin subunit
MKQNVILPKVSNSPAVNWIINFNDQLKEGEDLFLGQSDQIGLRLHKVNNKLLIFPRLCPHEGATLDGSSCKSGNGDTDFKIKCPWHGRAFTPVAMIELSNIERKFIKTKYHSIELTPENISIQVIT